MNEDLQMVSTDKDKSLELDEDILELLKNGNQIEAIKVYKDRYGLGLAESKQCIDKYLIKHYIETNMDNNNSTLKDLNTDSIFRLIIGIIFIVPGVLLIANDWIIIGLFLLLIGIVVTIKQISELIGGNASTIKENEDKKEKEELRIVERKRIFDDFVNTKISEFGELTKAITWSKFGESEVLFLFLNHQKRLL